MGIENAGVKKLGMRTIRQEKQTINAGTQRFLYSRAVGKDEVASSRQPRSGLVPCGNLASSSREHLASLEAGCFLFFRQFANWRPHARSAF